MGDAGVRVGVGAAVFLATLSAYTETLQPSVPGGDAGELIVEAHQLGLPHPPGYPLHTLLGHVVAHSDWLFGGSAGTATTAVGANASASMNVDSTSATSRGSLQSTVAWRLNFMSACFGAASGTFIYLAGMLMSDPLTSGDSAASSTSQQIVRHAAAIMGAVGFCASPLVWTYSITAEVFSLNNFFSALVVLLAIVYFEKTSPGTLAAQRCAIVGAFISGLGLCNQHSLIFFVVPLGLVVLGWSSCHVPAVVPGADTDTHTGAKGGIFPCVASTLASLAMYCALAFFVGLSLYLVYLPIGTGKRGAWGDGTTVVGFLTHVFRREYGTFMLHPDMISDEGTLERSRLYLEHLPSQLPFGSATDIHPRLSRRLSEEASDALTDTLIFDETVVACTSFGCIFVGAATTVWNSASGRAVALLWVSYLILFHSLSNIDLGGSLTFGVHARFWMQPNVIAFLWMGMGIRTVSAALLGTGTRCATFLAKQFGLNEAAGGTSAERRGGAQQWEIKYADSTAIIISLRQAASVAIAAALIATSAKTMRKRWPRMDQHDNWVLRDELLKAIDSLPPHALVLLRGDHVTNGMRYLQTCEKRRPDLAIFSDQLVKARWFPLQESKYLGVVFPKRRYITDEIFGFSLEELIRLNINRRPVFACDRLVTVHIQNTFKGLPWGLCEKVVHLDRETRGGKAFDKWWEGRETGWHGAKSLVPANRNFSRALSSGPGYRPESWEYKIFEKTFEKQQAVIATMITFAESSMDEAAATTATVATGSTKESILKKVRIRVAAILKQDLGPFVVQSATWKNMAVAHLTVPGALKKKTMLRGGLRALCRFIKHSSSEVDMDPQIKQVHETITRVAGILYQKFNYTAADLEKLGWTPDLKTRGI